MTGVLLVLARVAARVSMFVAVSLKSTVALLVSFNDTIATELLRAVLEAVVFAIQPIQHCMQHLRSEQYTTNIHRHQNPPRYCHVSHGRRCTVQPSRYGVAPITAKRDVIRKYGSTQRIATPPQDDRATG